MGRAPRPVLPANMCLFAQQSVGGEVPHPFDVNYQSLNARLTHISPEESVYKTIKQYVDATGSTFRKLEILDVWEVDRQTEVSECVCVCVYVCVYLQYMCFLTIIVGKHGNV